MLEQLEGRARAAAEARVPDRIAALADQLRALLPGGIVVEATEQGVLLSGPGFGQRFVIDASLRWTVAGLLK